MAERKPIDYSEMTTFRRTGEEDSESDFILLDNPFPSYSSTESGDETDGLRSRSRSKRKQVSGCLRRLRFRTVIVFLEVLRWVRDQIERHVCRMKKQHSSADVTRTITFNDPSTSVGFPVNYISTGKYTWLNFIFKFLWEQFRKAVNIYFLVIVILQQIPGVSPTGRYTTIVPLSVVLGIAALKEIIEDVKRHRADRQVNRRRVQVLREATAIRWQEVLVGDIVKVYDKEEFPADLVCLSTSDINGNCYIETSNLDGETNLKLRRSHVTTVKRTKLEDLRQLEGYIECEGPNALLYEFTGNMHVAGQRSLQITSENILLRGSRLRNTDYIYGIAVYTGHETKLLMNAHSTPLKRSTMDKTIDKLVLCLFATLIALSCLSAVAETIWTCLNAKNHFYLIREAQCYGGPVLGMFFYSLAQFIILYNNLVPISLIVTVEIVKFIQAIYINQDVEMYHEESGMGAQAKTSNLNEELGQVRYVFSDKTGTLTCNRMLFHKCSIGKDIYDGMNEEGVFCDAKLVDKLRQTDKSFANSAEKRFLEAMAVCHSVIPEVDPKSEAGIAYRASSPDEEALVKAAKKVGFDFVSRAYDKVTVVVFGKPRTYQVLNILEFTSERKRMSVIVRTPEGRLKLYTKGADSTIMERLRPNDPLVGKTNEYLQMFAEEGLRTLCLAEHNLSEDSYKSWSESYKAASLILHPKEKRKELDKLADQIEKNFALLGVTAVEDKLQDGVPEAIVDLRKANIKVWMLTGDKKETAINIGYSCKLLTPQLVTLTCIERELQTELSPFVSAVQARLKDLKQQILQSVGGDRKQRDTVDHALIIDGKALECALEDENSRYFFDVAYHCKTVICCRLTPGQKAGIVKVVKKYDRKATTLAIGDGANDVSMIQAADVGIGISGAEGLQATLASDYSIAQFRFLVRLLLVHGVWNYKRLALVILYSFYKNIVLYIMEFWFAFFNAFSGQIIFERWAIGFYNIFFTGLPPLALGIADQDVEAKLRMSIPERYRKTQTGKYFNVPLSLFWVAQAIFHSLVLFAIVEFGVRHDVLRITGYTGGLWFHGNLLYTTTLVTVLVKILLIAHSWNVLMLVAVLLSMLFWMVYLPIYGQLWPHINVGSEMTGVPPQLFASPYLYAYMLLGPMAVLLIDILYTVYRSMDFSKWYIKHTQRTHKELREITCLPCSENVGWSFIPPAVRRFFRALGVFIPFCHSYYDGNKRCMGSSQTPPETQHSDYNTLIEENGL